MFTQSRTSLWEIYLKRFIAARLRPDGSPALSSANEQETGAEKGDPAVPSVSRRCSAEAFRAAQSRKFQILRAKVMTKRAGTRKAIPHQDGRIPSRLLLFHSPRGTTRSTKTQRDAAGLRRKSHGIARSIEGLRGLRLSLVPRPNSRNCLLPAM